MRPARLGAVSYLNTRPLVYGLEGRPDLFDVRFDVPARCATRLHDGDVDLGLIPAVEYLRGDYRIVPGVAIASRGAVASVAVFSRRPVDQIRTLALDVSSRTSVALTRVLCAKRWGIAPEFTPAEPDLAAMLATSDAALLIGDLALYADPTLHDATKIDLGAEWLAMTGLPFVYAVWTGRDGAVTAEHVEALNHARDEGCRHLEDIAVTECAAQPDRLPLITSYLRHNLRYGLGDDELAGLRRFHELVAEAGLVPELQPLRFYHA